MFVNSPDFLPEFFGGICLPSQMLWLCCCLQGLILLNLLPQLLEKWGTSALGLVWFRFSHSKGRRQCRGLLHIFVITTKNVKNRSLYWVVVGEGLAESTKIFRLESVTLSHIFCADRFFLLLRKNPLFVHSLTKLVRPFFLSSTNKKTGAYLFFLFTERLSKVKVS